MRTSARRFATAAAALAATAVTLTACNPDDLDLSAAGLDGSTGSAAAVEATPGGADTGTGGEAVPEWKLTTLEVEQAKDTLATLTVKGKAPKTGYGRDEFGPSWTDNVEGIPLSDNGCDTRNDILARDMTDVMLRDGDDCIVESGVLHDPYTDTTINFERGRGTSSDVQIDHVVALANSWQTGAQNLSEQQRRQIANDPRNLFASDGPANMSKGDGDAATWLPPNKGFRCRYVATQINVKDLYNLWVTQPEKDAMSRVLSKCQVQ